MGSTKCFGFFSYARSECVFCLCVAITVLFAGRSAHATAISSALIVTAQEGADSGSWQMNFSSSNPVVWNSSGPINIYSSSHPSLFLGSLDAASLSLNSDPNVSLAFAVTAGGADTTFSISSPIVSFGALTNPQGFATAGITLTDNDGNGASFTGLFPGPKGYQAQYNGRSAVFTNLISPITAGPDAATATTSERFPVTGTTVVPGVVNDIESQWFFVLSANDSASGTSRFNVVPEPSSMVLAVLGFVGLVAWGWRRRKRSLA
jgi:hypothetical protein